MTDVLLGKKTEVVGFDICVADLLVNLKKVHYQFQYEYTKHRKMEKMFEELRFPRGRKIDCLKLAEDVVEELMVNSS